MNAIEVKDLHKAFGSLKAVDGVSFSVAQGEIFSLLGPNGAGKTTTISMLSCLLRPDGGDATIMGHSIKNDQMGVKSVLGVVPQEIALYNDLSARENLSFWGKMYGLRGAALKQRVEEVLELVGLGEHASRRAGKYSGGMKRRLNIGIALLHHPQVIIMDEPTVGIDPQSRRSILDGVRELNRQGATVLYTTHYMEEAEELSDHIAIVDHGRLIALGTHAELIRLVGEQTRIDLTLHAENPAVLPAWQAVQGVSKAYAEDGHLSVLAEDSNRVLPRLFESASSLGARITGIEINEPNLEAVFLHLTGRALRDG
jgi:ABC-2 type transport system ATP-binding protein